MINFKKEKSRSYWGMGQEDMVVFAELIWHLKHDPKPMGFHRKPYTPKQEKLINDFYDLIAFPDDFETVLNSRHGQ